MSREIHFHMKVEDEKKQLEGMDDFNTVASFYSIDKHKCGYLDFDILKKYYSKFKKEVTKTEINAILRRLNTEGEAKISFRDFSSGITP